MASRAAIAVILASTLCVITLTAQQPAERFEVVSIRRVSDNCPFVSLTVRCADPPPIFFRLFEGRLEASAVSTLDMIRVAYGLENADPDLVRGGSSWVSEDRYDLIGVTGDLATGTVSDFPHTRRQLQTLLADRFGLRIETSSRKQVPVEVLTEAGHRGSGLRPAASPCATAPSLQARDRTDVAAFAFAPPGSASGCDVRFIGGRLEARGITMADLARALSARLSTVVVDETGLRGHFDVSFVTLDSAAPLAIQMETQLGLMLLPGRRPVPVLSIKGARKPVED